MTRDNPGLHDDRDPENDVDVYGALWTAAPFPRLPIDAPNEVKNLTIDIDDPKRVYAIHRASRRHNFNILVERFIIQLRYGCKSSACTTSTCFSCRKRLARAAPVRRYNATSARTLAIYLASQDNPEKGLCRNPSADLPIPQISKYLKSNGQISPAIEANSISNGQAASGAEHGSKTVHLYKALSRNDSEQNQVEDTMESTKQDPNMGRGIVATGMEEAPTTDHRSFVQNVFGTVAFKMVEWLTPRNLEIMAKSGDINCIRLGGDAAKYATIPRPKETPETENEVDEEAKSPQLVSSPGSPTEDNATRTWPSKKTSTQMSAIPTTGEIKATTGLPESNYATNNLATHTPTSNGRRRPEFIDQPNPKGILSISPKKDLPTDIQPLSRDALPLMPKRRLSHQAVVASPQLHASDPKPVSDLKEASDGSPHEAKPSAPVSSKDGETQTSTVEPPKRLDADIVPEKEASSCPTPDSSNLILPQSLSRLTIEVIELICDILQTDDTAEKHFFNPQRIYEGLKRRQSNPTILKRRLSPQTRSGYPSALRDQWRSFVEQGFFDVLCKPDSLLRSFSNDDLRLFDTHTIWYLMLRMTRVVPSLVLDSLWNVAGTLFLPPEKLEPISDWAKESQSRKGVSSKPVSNFDAAQIVTICLHALVAVAPLVTDARQLANISRIRSSGLTRAGRNSSSSEPTELCLQYEDAFSDELALRLARRVFAAIPTRLRYGELLEHSIRSEEKREPNILDTFLTSLKSLDLGTPPILSFPDNEREFHKKRVPFLILDWARTVMLQDWNGAAEVSSEGSLGGALAMIAAIYNNRKTLLLGDIHFYTKYISLRLDPVDMPLEWLDFEPNRRTVHLLDYPYLFQPSTLVTYFRAINYSRMNQAYETAKATYGLMRSTISESNLMTDQERRSRLFERLSTATSRFIVLEIRRNNVLLDTFNSIWRREERELMRPLKIRLGEDGGEEGLDSGGVQQEFFRLAIAEALNPDYGTFTVDSRTKMTWFQPGSPEPLWKFELIGMIISLAVYNGLTLPVTFPKALYRKLLDEDVTELHHISDGWPDLANGLTTLVEWDEKDGLIEDIFARTYEFSVEQFGKPVSREMGTATQWPQFSDLNYASNPIDTPMVTSENRNSYVTDYIKWLTDVSIRPQFQAFKSGFFSCIDRRSITLFGPSTLQSVVEGTQEIDIPELRRATRYIGWEPSHRAVRDFWSVVKKYDLEDKKRLLEFVTASDRVPVGGMKNMQFTLQRNGVDDAHLPSSYTCYGILLLPEYSSKEVLRQKMAMALENSKGFGFA